MEFKKQRSHSIRGRIAITLLLLIIIQFFVFVMSLFFSDSLGKIESAAYNLISNQAYSRRNDIQNVMLDKMTNLMFTTEALNEELLQICKEHNVQPQGLTQNNEVVMAMLDHSMAVFLDHIRYNSISGLFLVLDATQLENNAVEDSRSAIYIRDFSPGITTANNEDILLECGPVDIARKHNITVDALWTYELDFTPGNGPSDLSFYENPIAGAMARPTADLNILGYWTSQYQMKANDIVVISYVLPLRDEAGYPFGVVGFDLALDELYKMMPSGDLPYQTGFYGIAIEEDGVFYTDRLIVSGAYGRQFTSSEREPFSYELINEGQNGATYRIWREYQPDLHVIGSLNQLRIYDPLSPYFDRNWYIGCFASEAAILEESNSIRAALAISISISVFLASILVAFFSGYLAKPIKTLVTSIHSIDPEKPVLLTRTNTLEIDEVANAFEELSAKVTKAAARMSSIINLVDDSISSFEIDYQSGQVFLSETFFKLAQLRRDNEDTSTITLSEWEKIAEYVGEPESASVNDDIKEYLYYISTVPGGPKRWFRVRTLEEENRTIGTVMDVSDEILQKQRLEYERNVDSLTKLLNRQAFLNKVESVILQNPDKLGVMMFADLDNLKKMNDSYGHEWGDRYLQRFAEALAPIREQNGVVGRISGDEFVAYLHGYHTEDEAREHFKALFGQVQESELNTPDGNKQKLQASVGLAFYPKDTSSVEDLVKYADFAMYETKHNVKGEINEFNLASYRKNSTIAQKQDLFELFIREERIKFVFQPIVNIKTGTVYAYEALMRPQLRELKSPMEVIQMARSQSKLYLVEKMIFSKIFEWIDIHKNELNDKKIFINSISNQTFIDADQNELETKYKHLFPYTVIEITENENSTSSNVEKKMNMTRKWGCHVAIDDFGSGYSNELNLLSINPEFIKIDMGLIHDIDKDLDRQQLTQNIITYATTRGIKTIAEGIETAQELEIVNRFGIDFVQGYFVGRPDFRIMDISDEVRKTLLSYHNERRKAEEGNAAKHTF